MNRTDFLITSPLDPGCLADPYSILFFSPELISIMKFSKKEARTFKEPLKF
ncbi:MAG: hypothetical protein ACOCUU_01760 [Nanoarchaeota archaeon]